VSSQLQPPHDAKMLNQLTFTPKIQYFEIALLTGGARNAG